VLLSRVVGVAFLVIAAVAVFQPKVLPGLRPTGTPIQIMNGEDVGGMTDSGGM
jgi:hypothetical protein